MSLCASRPVEKMVWNNEIESVKSAADLETSHSITGAKLHANFEVLDSIVASGLKKIISGDFKTRVFTQKEAAPTATLSHGKASRMDDQ